MQMARMRSIANVDRSWVHRNVNIKAQWSMMNQLLQPVLYFICITRML